MMADYDWRMYKLKNGTETAIWAANLIEQQAKEIEALRGFAQEVMSCWPGIEGFDGEELRGFARSHGLIEQTEVTERCGDFCWCAENEGFDEPVTCYRKTALLTGKTELNTQNSETVG